MNGVCEDVGVFGFGERVSDEGGIGCCVCWVELLDFWGVGSWFLFLKEAERERKHTEILGSITRDDYTGLSYRVESCELDFRVDSHRFCLSSSRGFIYERAILPWPMGTGVMITFLSLMGCPAPFSRDLSTYPSIYLSMAVVMTRSPTFSCNYYFEF